MEGHVKVTLLSTVTEEGVRQEIRQTGRGLLRREQDGDRLRLAASDESGRRSGWDLKFTGAGVTVRSITAGYTLHLDPARTTVLRYPAGGAVLELGIRTHRVLRDLDGPEEGRIEMEYTMLSGDKPVSELSLRLQMRKE